ncbi:unnamed protein product [Closterium sp. Yama58-4]|nr:unnamed protein product [Closterium sp. Yama58-4]
MGMHRQYVPLDSTKGGKSSAAVLVVAMVGSVAILVISVFIGVKLAQMQGMEPPPPPAKLPPPPVNITITSKIQMALMFLESQKSGKLDPDFPVTWRSDSGLQDGRDQNRDLRGGYYIGGSNIKYHFPMAYTVTMLCWALLEYESVFRLVNMHNEMAELIDWGVQYILRTRYEDLIFAQVGTPEIDDVCWIRPEDMKPAQRPTMFPCDIAHPCSDLAGEYSAALAAASLTFRVGNPSYADVLLQNAEEIFEYADQYRGKYSDWVEAAQTEYNSTGYGDELMWGATWLYFASGDSKYLDYVVGPNSYIFETNQWGPGTKTFDWDNKSPGVQVLMTRLLMLGYGAGNEGQIPQYLQTYLNAAKLYVCQHTPHWLHANFTDSGGLIYVSDDHPIQYAVNAGFLSVLVSDYLRIAINANVSSHYLDCDATIDDIVDFAASQVNYILGDNPQKMSYMVGFGDNYPTRVHHRAASITSRHVDPTPFDCVTGRKFKKSKYPNPNVLVGAIVGGPARDDSYLDDRTIPQQSEPLLYVNAVFAGLLASLGAFRSGNSPGNSLTRMWAQIPWAKKYAESLEELIPKPYPSPPKPPVSPPPWRTPPPKAPKFPPKRNARAALRPSYSAPILDADRRWGWRNSPRITSARTPFSMDVFPPIHQLPPSAATTAPSASASSSASAPSISASGSAPSATFPFAAWFSSLPAAVLRLPPSFCSALSIRKSSFVPTLIVALLLTLAASRFVSFPNASRVPSSRAAHVDADALGEAGHVTEGGAEGGAERWGQGERGKTSAQEGHVVGADRGGADRPGAHAEGAEGPEAHLEGAERPAVERPGVYGEGSAGEGTRGGDVSSQSGGSLGKGSAEAEGVSEGREEGGPERGEQIDNEGDSSDLGVGQGNGGEDGGGSSGAVAADGRCLVCEQLARLPCIEDAPHVRWLPDRSNKGGGGDDSEAGERGGADGGVKEGEEAKREWVWDDRDSSGSDSINGSTLNRSSSTTSSNSSSSSKGRQCVFHKMAGGEALRQLAGTWIVVAGDSESQQEHVFVPTSPNSLSSPPSSGAPPPLPTACPDVVILGSGLWHMLWVTDPQHFAAELAVLRSTVLRLLRSPRCSGSLGVSGGDGDGDGVAGAAGDGYGAAGGGYGADGGGYGDGGGAGGEGSGSEGVGGVGERGGEARGESVDEVAVAVVEGMRRAAAKEGSKVGGNVDKEEEEEEVVEEGEVEEEEQEQEEEGGGGEGVAVKRRKGLVQWDRMGGKAGEGRMGKNIEKGVGARRSVQEEGASGDAEDARRRGEETGIGAEEARKHEVDELMDGRLEGNGYGEDGVAGFGAEGDDEEEVKQGGESGDERVEPGVVSGEDSEEELRRDASTRQEEWRERGGVSGRVGERQSEGEGLGFTGGDEKGEVEMVEMEEGVGMGEEEQKEGVGGKLVGTPGTHEEEGTVGGAYRMEGREGGGEGEGEGLGEGAGVGVGMDEGEVKGEAKIWNKEEEEEEKEQGEEQEKQQAGEGKAIEEGGDPKGRAGESGEEGSEEDKKEKVGGEKENEKDNEGEGKEEEEEQEEKEEEEGQEEKEEEENTVVVRGAPLMQPLFFWLGLPELIQSRLNTERKREKMSPRMVNLYDAVVQRSGLLVERARGKVGGSVAGGERGSEEEEEEGSEEGGERGGAVESGTDRKRGGGSSGFRDGGGERGDGRETVKFSQVEELGPCVLLPLRELSKGCGESCTPDGMHYNDDTYAAAVQVMLNHAARLL